MIPIHPTNDVWYQTSTLTIGLDGSIWPLAGAGDAPQQGTVSGSITLTGTATGKAVRKATVTATIAGAGAATGKAIRKATVAGSISLSGAGTGKKKAKGTATGAVSLTGAATGSLVSAKAATVSGSISLTGAATGKAVRKGSATGTIALTGIVSGQGSLFAFTAPTQRQALDNRLGRSGVGFPVGRVVIIDPDCDVRVEDILRDPSDINGAREGAGDFGKSIFRRGGSYMVSRAEKNALVTAGLMEDPE